MPDVGRFNALIVSFAVGLLQVMDTVNGPALPYFTQALLLGTRG